MAGLHHHLLESHSHLTSPVHCAPAGIKVLTALAIVVAIVVTPPSVLFLSCIAILLIALLYLSQIPGRFVLTRLVFLEPFVLGVAILSLLQPHGGAIFATIAARSTLCLLTMILLSNTTPFSDLLAVMKKSRVPGLLVTTITLMHRYLYVLIEETERMKRARACRTFQSSRRRQWGQLAAIIGQLFSRSTDRAERIYAAMCSRGWKS